MPLKLGQQEAKGSTLVILRDCISEGHHGASVQEIGERLGAEPADMSKIIGALEQEGYIKETYPTYEDGSKSFAERVWARSYHLTVEGARTADHYQTYGGMPKNAGMPSNTTTFNISAPTQIAHGNSGPTHFTQHNGMDQGEFQSSLQAFLLEMQNIRSTDDREHLQLLVSQLSRAVQAGEPVEPQVNRIVRWLQESGPAITNAAIRWTLLKGTVQLVNPTLAHQLPDALPGLGQ